ncbi:MAG: HAD family hydrolase [Candidatus Hodarchaeota archaeon]
MPLKTSDIYLFFDDGGVLNDNQIRGEQWQKLVGIYLSPRFGGDPELWAKANVEFIKDFAGKEVPKLVWEHREKSYYEFLEWFIEKWVNNMFDYMGINRPERNKYKQIYYGAAKFVDSRIKAAFPGVIKSIENLYNKGYNLCTSSGMESIELKLYLEGMGIKQYFKAFYGPDLVNILKIDDKFYRAIFTDLNVTPEQSIVIDDKPFYLKHAEKLGAIVIQACLTGEYTSQFPYIITHMSELPVLIEEVIGDNFNVG